MTEDKNQQQGQRDLSQNKNETLKDPGARVADYGRADQGLEGGEEQKPQQDREQRSGNSSIPMDEDDTLGIP